MEGAPGEEQGGGGQLEPRALAIARKTGAIFASSLETSASPAHAPIRELDPLDELSRIVSENAGREYRIQFLGAGTDQGPTILAEVEVRF